MFRFRKIIERPDWEPPQAVSLEICYDAEPAYIPYGEDSEDCEGGVRNASWTVVAVKGPVGYYSQPEIFAETARRVSDDPVVALALIDWCMEDFAQREPSGN